MQRFWYLLPLLLCLLLAACGQVSQRPLTHPRTRPTVVPTPSPTPALSIVQQRITPTTGHTRPASGPTPYGSPPVASSLESGLTRQLFAQINQDRAARGLYAFTWNATLASGARLHSWNMFHCGFSHTCPDGLSQCTRIASEGFSGFSDCGECIGLAGPSNPSWTNVYAVQESMINEPPDGWHRIHLTSKTLHRLGVGIYIAPNGWVWFTEDILS
ncbi:MAG TPA: CAP domain-containing protein [Ktedonobacteraceae bacterium]|jgi:uncharacterized protein YkwD